MLKWQEVLLEKRVWWLGGRLQVGFLSWDGRCQPRTHPESEGLGPAVYSTELLGPWLCSDTTHWTESSPSLDSVQREG